MNNFTLYNFDYLYNAHLQAKKHKAKKMATLDYEQALFLNLLELEQELKSHTYKPKDFKNFYVYEPKQRLIQAPAYEDKIVLHLLTDNVLYESITKSFIRDNYASQKNKGQLDGLIRLKRHLIKYYAKNKIAEGWILKADIHHFFASINHNKLKKVFQKMCLKRNIDQEIYNLLCTYIDTSEGLPLGYQTSQLLALLFLDDFDHWIKEKKKIKYYGRYMDDFYLISSSKQELQLLLKEIKQYMKELDLELNNKTAIFPLKNGIDFLGFHTYLTDSGKVVMKLRRANVKKIKRKVKKWKKDFLNKKITKQKIKQSWQAWDAYAAFGNTYKFRLKIANEIGAIIHEQLIPRKQINSTQVLKEYRKLQQMNAINKKYNQDTLYISKIIFYIDKEALYANSIKG